MLDLAHHSLIETDWLAAHLDAPELRIVDARWRGDGSGRQRYLAGHIPGAVYLDWDRDLSYGRRGAQPAATSGPFCGNHVRRRDRDETRVVAYAGPTIPVGHVYGGRCYYGHDQVAVLNGGLASGWRRVGPSVLSSLSRRWPIYASPQAQLLATAARSGPWPSRAGVAWWTRGHPCNMPAAPSGRRMAAYTCRPDRTGWSLIATSAGGHIPGAIHLHASSNLDPRDWTYLPPDLLRERALAASIQPEQRIVTCAGRHFGIPGLICTSPGRLPEPGALRCLVGRVGQRPGPPVERDETPV
jgi:thiosulfate/3-mercaptopyruvate sulfurtransferase